MAHTVLRQGDENRGLGNGGRRSRADVPVTKGRTDIPHGGQAVAGFEAVQQEFIRGLPDFGTGGGGFAAYVDGKPVVDVWGGYAGNQPWAEDNLAVVMSTTKGLITLCAQVLVDRHQLDIDAPVVRYWPEFGQCGKEGVLVRHFLTHTSGVLGFDVQRPPLGWDGQGWGDYDAISAGLAASTPRWTPGTKFGYHALSYGWLVGELVRRITGQSVGTFFAAEIAGPLALEAWIGTPPEHEHQVAPVIDDLTEGLPLPVRLLYRPIRRRMRDPKTMIGQAFVADGTSCLMDHAEDLFNTKRIMGVEIPSGNGTASARSLARLYAVLAMGGELDGIRLLSPETVQLFAAQAISLPDQLMIDMKLPGLGRMLSRPVRRTLGYLMNPKMGKEPPHFGPNPDSFGHDGAGGQIAFCDLTNRISVGFVRSRLGSSSTYSTRLIESLYDCAKSATSS
jgi:CubicO group peptidase (beta-lactamase class C family)